MCSVFTEPASLRTFRKSLGLMLSFLLQVPLRYRKQLLQLIVKKYLSYLLATLGLLSKTGNEMHNDACECVANGTCHTNEYFIAHEFLMYSLLVDVLKWLRLSVVSECLNLHSDGS